MISLLTALIAGTAQGAEVTALPPAMRGDVGIAYDVRVVPDTLIEDETEVGRRRAIDHTLVYTASFGLTKILALEIALPHSASSRMRFFDSQRMVYEPNQGKGTMIGTAQLPSDPEVHGSGMGGTRFGLALTPFSETAYASRGDNLTWLMRAGYQLQDKSNIWTHRVGERGGLDGASGLLLESVFSTTNNMSQPYMGLRYEKHFPLRTDIVDASGDVVARDLDVQVADTVTLTTGLEIEVYRNEDFAKGLGTAVFLEPRASFGWRSGAEIPSGVKLPSVLSMTENTLVGQSETSTIWGGMSATWRIIRYLDWDTSFDMGTPLSYRVEHPYEVSTGMGKLGWQVGTGLTFRMRDPLFDPPKK
jgi:hypothetical protein